MSTAIDDHSVAPLVRAIPFVEPATLLPAFQDDPALVFLDSARADGGLGRYSFLAAAPFQCLESKDRVVSMGDRQDLGDPFAALKAALADFPLRRVPDLPPFQGGIAGYFGYDLGRHLEQIPVAPLDDVPFPDLCVGFFDVVAAFDLTARRAWIFSSGYPETGPAARARRAAERADALADRIAAAARRPAPSLIPTGDVQIDSNFTRPDHEAAVQRVIDYILAGDIFQANLSQRFKATLSAGWSPLALYQRLRALNPAPFAAYLRFGDVAVASSSPERFLKLDGRRVESRPIKGTRPRGATPAADEALAAELLASEKDRAENVMIVDLLRNDLSRVCLDSSVAVPELCVLERYATVFHLVSTITGTLRDDAGPIELLQAGFPGGSITGAPKIRAMEILAALEPTRRGPYCGSIGYIGFDGSMDTNIVIRTYAIKGDVVTFQAGGGIVADSRPESEYEETMDKARALRAALSGEARVE